MLIELLYRLFVLPAGVLGWLLALPFSRKARSGWAGRKRSVEGLKRSCRSWGSAPRLWFHCSSLGEFEQAVPVLRDLRVVWPDAVLAVTIFSPSGHDRALASGEADWVGYLPFDTKKNVSLMLDVLKPAALIFMRYDMWPSLLSGARRRRVPVVVASAALNPRSPLRTQLLSPLARFLYGGTSILAVTHEEETAFAGLLGDRAAVEAMGDPRYDRVLQRAAEPGVTGDGVFSQGSLILAAGSTHAPDEDLLGKALTPWPDPSLRVLLVPHDPTARRLAQVERLMSELGVASRRWSELGGSPADVPVVIVDSVGHLAHLYRGCHMAYVGGGFGAGVHSVLEPAAVGLPVLFGPKHWRSPEARALVARTGATVVRRPEELTNVLQSLCSDVAVRENRGRICRSLVTEGAGASKRVAERVASIAKASG